MPPTTGRRGPNRHRPPLITDENLQTYKNFRAKDDRGLYYSSYELEAVSTCNGVFLGVDRWLGAPFVVGAVKLDNNARVEKNQVEYETAQLILELE